MRLGHRRKNALVAFGVRGNVSAAFGVRGNFGCVSCFLDVDCWTLGTTTIVMRIALKIRMIAISGPGLLKRLVPEQMHLSGQDVLSV